MNEVRPQRERRERDDGFVDGHKILLLHKNGEESEAGAIWKEWENTFYEIVATSLGKEKEKEIAKKSRKQQTKFKRVREGEKSCRHMGLIVTLNDVKKAAWTVKFYEKKGSDSEGNCDRWGYTYEHDQGEIS